ncbi:hypothetical protein KUTeg_006175 [Tegillarca granosa]|uniref:Peroxidase n=1 Tax=Tegillarca granosa TaxID=220873 RepID=A0ABQ9FFR6_TEGGR|nr:hypothetical protein KUTeg_006175 [Tegillarca granosa]
MCDTPTQPHCNPNARYRTFDGSCNNLRNPLLGTPVQPQSRFLPPEYVGDIDLPRTKSLQNERLPRVRPTSNTMNSKNQGTCLDDVTVAVLSWGTLVVRDTLETPSTSIKLSVKRAYNVLAECFHINVNDDDPYFNVTCLDFVRASPILADQCRPGRRQQINQLNSYLDASQVYGLSEADNDKIRVYRGGLLKVNNDNIPDKQDSQSIDEIITQTAFFRLHNIYAKQLSHFNPFWNDEKIFQETRKIIGAVVQKITYDEYLTTFLNDETREKYCLKSSCRQYDETEDPQLRVGYSVAAGRFGHSRIPPLQRFVNNILRVLPGPTSPSLLKQLVDDILQEKAGCVDR